MRTWYEVLDAKSGNVVGDYGTLEEVRAILAPFPDIHVDVLRCWDDGDTEDCIAVPQAEVA